MVLRRNGEFVVNELFQEAPADRAGMRIGDVLVKIGEKKLDGNKLDMGDVRQLLR